MKKKKPRETADTGFFAQARPAEKKSLLSMLISAGLGVLTVLVSLFPLWIKTPENKNVLYNFLGGVNQDVGSDAVRDDNVPLLLFYYAGVVLLAVGCIGVYNKLKIAPVFLVFAAVSLLFFAGGWMNVPFSENSTATEAFSDTPIPAITIFLAVSTLIASVLSVGFVLKQMQQPVRKR